MRMFNDLHNIFCSWGSKLEELAEYFQDKYNFDIDDEDLKATKETIMEMANDVPKLASLALYGKDRTESKKVAKVIIANGKIKHTEQISIVLNDKETAERILHKLHCVANDYGGFDIYDIEQIVKNITDDPDFHIEADYALFTREETYYVYMINRRNEYEIIFPPQGMAITLGRRKED